MAERGAGFAWVQDFFHAHHLLVYATLFESIIEHAWSLKSNAARWLHAEPNLELNNFLKIISGTFISLKDILSYCETEGNFMSETEA